MARLIQSPGSKAPSMVSSNQCEVLSVREIYFQNIQVPSVYSKMVRGPALMRR